MRTAALLSSALFVLFNSQCWADPGNTIDRLDWMIGEWSFDDQEVNGDYRETGSRVCTWTLDKKYIQCANSGTNHRGKERTTVWYISYNSMDERYEIVGMFGDYPRKNLYVATPDETGHVVELVNESWSADGMVPMNLATITYDGGDEWLWEIRTGQPNPETGAHPVTFRDLAVRVD